MAGIRALSVSKTTPTFTGNPPDAVMRRLIVILKINTGTNRGNSRKSNFKYKIMGN